MKKAPAPSRSKDPSIPPITSKPFCNCNFCANQKCPNILELFPIPLTDDTKTNVTNKTDFDSKVKNQRGSDTKSPKGKQQANKGKGKRKKKAPARSSIMDVLNDDRDCSCEVAARAVRKDVAGHLGLSALRQKINTIPETILTPDPDHLID